MNLRKFFGSTSRAVLDQVRTELGPDAMIVANRATADGIEITALAGDALPAMLSRDALSPQVERRRNLAPRASSEAAHDDGGVSVSLSRPMLRPSPEIPKKTDAATAKAGRVDEALSAQVMEQVSAMRVLLEEQFTRLALSDALKRAPLRAKILGDLLNAGYSASLAREIVRRLPDDFAADEAQRWVAGVLTRNLHCIDGENEIVSRGGIYALIGPTGVGKTTTTAKLAARCAVRYGASKLALITTDSYRVGAQDQLRVYAKILGVAVHTVSDRHDMKQALDTVRGRHLVLIDTVGIGQRDRRVTEQALLLAHPEINRLLLMNAATHPETLEEVVQMYGRSTDAAAGPLAGAIVTKIDEAARTGSVLDAAVRHKLPLHYVTNGQRVPEDLFLPQAPLLIERSLRRAVAKSSPFTLTDDELPLVAIPGGAHA
jgi:flagellar biosynthesis protein FlhF